MCNPPQEHISFLPPLPRVCRSCGRPGDPLLFPGMQHTPEGSALRGVVFFSAARDAGLRPFYCAARLSAATTLFSPMSRSTAACTGSITNTWGRRVTISSK